MRCHSFCAFGLSVESDFPLPGVIAQARDGLCPRVTVRFVDKLRLEQCWSGNDGPPAWRASLGDGSTLEGEVGSAGDHLITYGSAVFRISPDGASVLCCVQERHDPKWERQLLDTVLYCASFVSGSELLHASAVEFDAGVVAFVARSGGGKSSLAADLVKRGRRLFSDDVLAIRARHEDIFVFPGPAVMNLPEGEIRPEHLGADVIARFPQEREAWIRLPNAATSASRLIAVYVLERSAVSQGVYEVEATFSTDILPQAISLPHDCERARDRFLLFAALAERIVVRKLRIGPSVGPALLADLVERSLERMDSTRVAA